MNANQPIHKQIKLAGNRQSFLLRVWRENGRSPWRIMLQPVNDNKRHYFTTVESFTAHLEACLNDKNC